MVNSLYNKLKKNEKCYQFKHMANTDGIFNKTIDATYVLHLEGNGRHESVIKQLNEYHLTNDVYILYNKGFSNFVFLGVNIFQNSAWLNAPPPLFLTFVLNFVILLTISNKK